MAAESRYLRSFTPGWGSVLRMALWCLLFLWLFGRAVPMLPEEIPLAKTGAGASVIPMLTIVDDHRTVREDIAPDPKKLHIAWVTDSSGAIVPPGKKWSQIDSEGCRTIPEFVGASLKKRHKLDNFDIPLYMRLGARPVDSLVFALLAAREKPDVIVISVNIILTFSHYRIMNKTTSLNIAPSLWGLYPKLWYMIPMFCNPVQNLWALLGSRIGIIRYASPFKNELERRYAALFKALGGSGPAPISLGAAMPMFIMKFWIVMNMLNGDEAPMLDADGKAGNREYYTQLINHNSPYHDGSFATAAFMDTIEALKASGVPVLIYQHPVSDYFYGMPETAQKIRETQDFLDKMDQSLKGTGIHLIGAIPEEVRKSFPFRKDDGYHADSNPAKFDEFLADQIWLMLKNNGKLPEKDMR